MRPHHPTLITLRSLPAVHYSALLWDRVLRQDLLFTSYPRSLLHVHYPPTFITHQLSLPHRRSLPQRSIPVVQYTNNRSPSLLGRDLVQSDGFMPPHSFINIRYTNIRLHHLWAKTSVCFGALRSFQISISPRRPTFITLTLVRHTSRSSEVYLGTVLRSNVSR